MFFNIQTYSTFKLKVFFNCVVNMYIKAFLLNIPFLTTYAFWSMNTWTFHIYLIFFVIIASVIVVPRSLLLMLLMRPIGYTKAQRLDSTSIPIRPLVLRNSHQASCQFLQVIACFDLKYIVSLDIWLILFKKSHFFYLCSQFSCSNT